VTREAFTDAEGRTAKRKERGDHRQWREVLEPVVRVGEFGDLLLGDAQ
jgi:hypothetical protein